MILVNTIKFSLIRVLHIQSIAKFKTLTMLSLIFFLVLVLNVSAQHVYYVMPNGSSPLNCPSQPCLSLDHYTQQREIYFTTGSTFVFLAGNHSLQTAVSLSKLSDITLRRDLRPEENSSHINIICRDGVTLSLNGVTNMTINGLKFAFNPSPITDESAALFTLKNSEVNILNTTFQGSGDLTMTLLRRGIYSTSSTLKIAGSTFTGNTGHTGGAILALESNIILSGCTFIRNKAFSAGGAILVTQSSITLEGSRKNAFIFNSCAYGGVLSSQNSTINMRGTNIFRSNIGNYFGGALYLAYGRIAISGTTLFLNNEADEGGAISSYNTVFQYTNEHLSEHELGDAYLNIHVNTKQLYFIGNTASYRGGALLFLNDESAKSAKILISGYFRNNTAGECGGAMYFNSQMDIEAENVSVIVNKGSAICMIDSSITFTGVTRILNNKGKYGGGIYSERSSIKFTGENVFAGNHATFGGAIYSVYGILSFSTLTLFTQNMANADGGALYVLSTEVTLSIRVEFTYNSANNGGAMYLGQSASLTFDTSITEIVTAYNHASAYGGLIFHEDTATPIQCSFIVENNTQSVTHLSRCFFRIRFGNGVRRNTIKIYTHNDSAGQDGVFLYGGLLDRCRINIENENVGYLPYEWIERYILRVLERKQNETKKTVTSQPYQLCFCENDATYSCSEEKTVHIYKGQRLRVSLLALDQTEDPVSTTVKALTSSSSRIQPNQDPQSLPQGCSDLSYNLYSTDNHEQLIVYPDGPCHDSGLAKIVINVTLLPCPDAFTQSGDHCVCEERLQDYADCVVDDDILIRKKSGSKFWMGVLYNQNETYQGLILYNTCPAEYCITDGTVQLTLDSLDVQCNLNRSGILCGSCTVNCSLMLGSSKCQICSNAYLALLLPFAAVGIALVVFLSILRLTVVTGMINSVIFYANIVQVNRNIFLPSNTRNILTVFIAWLNLDLGFQTCFYDGMDAYIQTWLQFAFPIYIWILIGLIILTSRYSITVSKLVGHNPIAVLATLILMSYAKILKIIIEVYSSVELEYPHNKTVTVWLKDANTPYLQSWHLLLTVVTTLIIVFFFLPYTVLLLLGYKLYRFTGKKYFRWFDKIKPLLDSYYAPYRIHTRYWTGFLLLVRCALYIVFSFNSLGGTIKSLLTINIAFTTIVVIAWLSVKIYRSFVVTIIEASVYLNLIILSASALAEANSPALVYSLIGIVFVTMIAIILYHFHVLYTAKLATWLKTKAKITSIIEKLKSLKGNKKVAQVSLDNPTPRMSHDPHKIATKSVIDLREPLLENN